MAFFQSFSDPRDYVIRGYNEEVDTKAPSSTPVHQDPTSELGKSPENEKKSGGAIITNKYNPDAARVSEGGYPMDARTGQAIWEHMDMSDIHTVETVCAMNEAEQNSLLLSLTNKLYKMIVDKIDSIDYGEIPNTRGDITKLSKYDELRECHKVLRGIFQQFREKDEPINVLEDAVDNIVNMKDIFVGAYMAKAEFPKSVYNTMTLAVINATSFMIATCIEYIKNPKKEGLEIVLNKTGVAKAKEHLVYISLKDFNEACRKGEVENALRPFVQNRAKGFVMTAAIGIKAALVIGGVVLAILPIMKDLVYFYYASKARVSQYFDLQAKLLEMNANELRDNADIKTEGDKASVIRRQLAIAKTFHDIANYLTVDAKGSEVEATKEIKKDKQSYKIDDVEPNAAEGGPLF